MEWLLAALLGGALLFNSAATPGKAEKAMEVALRKTYPQATVDATVEGKRGRSVLKGNFRRVRLQLDRIGEISDLPFSAGDSQKTGHVNRLELALSNFRFNSVPVDKADFSFNEVTYDLNALKKDSKLSIVRSGAAQAELNLDAKALESIFEKSLDGVTNIKIELRDGLVRLNAKKTVPLINVGVPFYFTARPIVQNNDEIWLTDGRIAMEDVTGFSLKVKNLLADLNPVYTFDPDKKWPYRVKLTGVSARDNQMLLKGDLVFIGKN